MHERLLPPSPNWYCSRCSDTNAKGILGFGARNTIYLVDVSLSWPAVVGELLGHRERVSGLSFSPHPGQEHQCASTSDDGTVKIWDTDEKVLLKEHKTHQSTITAVHWSPVDKDLVVSGDEKGVVICYWQNRDDACSFFPEPRHIFCLSCSPHDGNLVAVGYKDGMIVLIDITKKNEVICRLRGHEDEIHALSWCPQVNEGGLQSHTDGDAEADVGVVERGCYLASGSKDKTVRIWSTARGRGVLTLKLPFLKRRGAGVDPAVKERLWLTVHWPKRRPAHVISSSFGGELVIWDLTKSDKQKWSLLGASSDGQNHSRIVFNVSSVSFGEDRQRLFSTSMDREIKCWDLNSLECCWTLPTLGGFLYSMAFSPVGTGCLALGVGDNMVRVWNTLSLSNKYDVRVFWQGIKSKVTALAWHPTKEGSLAFGTDDGKVGIYEVFSNKPPQISSTYHRKTVYALAWGPPVQSLSSGSDAETISFNLYSCAGEGTILQHNPKKLTSEATDIDKVIRSTNNIKHKLAPHTDLSWKPDGKALAIGNEDGSIDVYSAPDLRLLCTIQQHHKIINTLCWHHDLGCTPDVTYLLASGSGNALVLVHDLRGALESTASSPIMLMEPYCSLAGHTAKITSLSWSPHHSGRLVTVCYDGTAQVWDVLRQEPLCNYRGHQGRLLCVAWSPQDPDVIWTGGDDFTVQEWAISKQEHDKPPRGRKAVELDKKRAQTKYKSKKIKKPSKKPPAKAGDEGVNEEEEKVAASEGPEEMLSDHNDEGESENSSSTPPLVSTCSKDAGGPAEQSVSEGLKSREKPFAAVKKELKEEKKREYQESLLKKKKLGSLLPLSASMDHRPREDLQRDCLTLAALKSAEAAPGQRVPGSGDHIHLGLFADRDALYRMFEEEEQGHVDSGHYESAIFLLLWKGDLGGALQMATDKGQLTEHLVSMAPMAGYQAWTRTVEAYVKQLCFQKQFLKAASYLLSLHKVYEAVELLKSHQLFREAIALAKARLQPQDPVLKDLYTSWASVLEKCGHYTAAAKCYLAAGSSYDAVKVITKKADISSLKTATELAKMLGEKEADSLSLRFAKELMLAQDWIGIQETLSTQENLLGYRLLFCTYEMLLRRMAAKELGVFICTSSHGWSEPCSNGFFDAVQKVWEKEFGISSGAETKIQIARKQLKMMENPTVTTNVSLGQLLYQMSVDMALGLLCWLLEQWGEGLQELLGCVRKSSGVQNFCLMSEICRLLFPQGTDSVAECKNKLEQADETSLAAAQSLEAWVCYVRLYELWWRKGGSDEDDGMQSDGAEVESGLVDGLDVNLCRTLLSEPHASYQASQKVLEEIQRRLSVMVHQHSSTRDDQPNSCDAHFPEQGRESESLPNLIAKVAEQQKKQADIADHVKNFPFPDVTECCLVLLHMDRTLGMVPTALTDRARDLLQRYGAASPRHCC